jgi:hypothetical protein
MRTPVSGRPRETNQSQDRLGTLKAAHYELLAAYADALALATRLDESESVRLSFAPRFIRSHIRAKLNELITPYTYLGESTANEHEKEWTDEAIKSLERFRDGIPYRSLGVVMGLILAKLRTWILAVVGVIGGLKLAEKYGDSVAKRVTESGFMEDAAWIAIGVLWTPLLLVVMFAGFWVAGFYGKRDVFLGSTQDVIGLKRATSENRPRAGKNIYELEDKVFKELSYGKTKEHGFDVVVAGWVVFVTATTTFVVFMSSGFDVLSGTSYILFVWVLAGYALVWGVGKMQSRRQWR